jgi:hypothetical protein
MGMQWASRGGRQDPATRLSILGRGAIAGATAKNKAIGSEQGVTALLADQARPAPPVSGILVLQNAVRTPRALAKVSGRPRGR